MIVGIRLMRKVIATPALAAAEPGALTAQLEARASQAEPMNRAERR